jgi:ADP-heptose:LPS heptosyltransferase
MSEIKKILLIRLAGIGDIMFTLPAVHMIRENLPDCRITYLTTQSFASLLKGFPGIENLITIDRALYRRRNPGEIFRSVVALISQLREERFDLAVDFQGFSETALLARVSGAKQRWGFLRRQKKQPLYTMGYLSRPLHHLPIDINREILIAGGLAAKPVNNRYQLPREELNKAGRLFEQLGLSPLKTTIFIQPFSNNTAKNWPLEQYVTYADYWAARGVQIIFGGGPADTVRLEAVASQYPVSAGKAGLLTSAGLMKLSTVVVGGDTGLLHLSVALGQRIIMLMGPTRPQDFGPYNHFDWTIASEKGTAINQISVDRVIEATATALRERGGINGWEK